MDTAAHRTGGPYIRSLRLLSPTASILCGCSTTSSIDASMDAADARGFDDRLRGCGGDAAGRDRHARARYQLPEPRADAVAPPANLVARPSNGIATASMVLGILGIVL